MGLKFYKRKIFIPALALLGLGLFLLRDSIGLQFAVIGAVGMLLGLIDRYLWKVRPFSWMYSVPDFSGRYDGWLNYEYRDHDCTVKKGSLRHVKLIEQSGSKLKIRSFTYGHDGQRSSESASLGLDVQALDENGHFQITFGYLNDGNTELGFPPHYGMDVIKFIKQGNSKILTGNYFTNRLPFQTRGTYTDLKWVSDDLTHNF